MDAVRTPIGSFRSKLSKLSAPELGAITVKAVLERTKVPADAVQGLSSAIYSINDLYILEVFYGNVIQANLGQAPARQVALKGGLSPATAVTTVNKVCSSGLKSVILAAQQIQLNHQQVCLAGGMESMSNCPFYLSRDSPSYGHFQALDSILKVCQFSSSKSMINVNL